MPKGYKIFIYIFIIALLGGNINYGYERINAARKDLETKTFAAGQQDAVMQIAAAVKAGGKFEVKVDTSKKYNEKAISSFTCSPLIEFPAK
jgi:hypothetical protein